MLLYICIYGKETDIMTLPKRTQQQYNKRKVIEFYLHTHIHQKKEEKYRPDTIPWGQLENEKQSFSKSLCKSSENGLFKVEMGNI